MRSQLWMEDGRFEETRAPYGEEEEKRTRRLLRSRSSRMLGGVCGGIAAYLGIDPTLIRIPFVLFTLVSGVGMLLYLAMWVIIPSERRAPEAEPGTNRLGVGLVILVVISLIAAAANSHALPLIMIVTGVWLIVRSRRTRRRYTVPSVPSLDLDAESEAAWCRNFNVAMARKGDPTRIHPGEPFCPRCGAATGGGAFCSHCGTKIEVSHQNPR